MNLFGKEPDLKKKFGGLEGWGGVGEGGGGKCILFF